MRACLATSSHRARALALNNIIGARSATTVAGAQRSINSNSGLMFSNNAA